MRRGGRVRAGVCAVAVVERIDAERDGRWLVLLVAHGDVLQILQAGFAGRDPREHRSLPHLPTATLRALEV